MAVATDPYKCDVGGTHELVYGGRWRDAEGRMQRSKYYRCSKCGDTITKEMLNA